MKFEAIGTTWEIEILDNCTVGQSDAIYKKVLERIDLFDKDYSRFRSDSLVTEMSRKAGKYKLPDDAKELFDTYKKIHDLTEGKVTPLIGNVMEDAGYDASYSFKSKELRAPHSWSEAMEYSYPDLTIKIPALLDLGAGGKGYLVDIVGELLASAGIESFFINAGGDILHSEIGIRNGGGFKVGLEDPDDASLAIGVANIWNESMCGSAGNRRAWGDFHHIIDPHDLRSPKNIIATWTIASTTLIADLLSTALFFASPDKLLSKFSFEYLVLYADRSIRKSGKFPSELFVKG